MRAVKIPRHKGGGMGPKRESYVFCGGPIAMVPCSHQGNIYIKKKAAEMERREICFHSRCKTPLTCTGCQTTSSQIRRYGAEKGNLCALRWTYRHGTVFAPKEYLYEKEATGMERPEMYFPNLCKNHTHLCGPSKYPVSREAV